MNNIILDLIDFLYKYRRVCYISDCAFRTINTFRIVQKISCSNYATNIVQLQSKLRKLLLNDRLSPRSSSQVYMYCLPGDCAQLVCYLYFTTTELLAFVLRFFLDQLCTCNRLTFVSYVSYRDKLLTATVHNFL